MPSRPVLSVLLALLGAITYLDRVCLSVAGPRIQDEFGLGPREWGWVLGAFSLAYALFEIPSGAFGDRWGPRTALVRIVGSWSLFTAATGLVPNFSALVAVRFLFGAGEAGAFPNASIAISRWFPGGQRARAFGVLWMASQLGGALAPLLAMPLQIRYGWRAVFFVFGFAGWVWCAAWLRYTRGLPESRQDLPDGEANRREAVRALFNRSVIAVMGVALTYCYAMYFFIGWIHTYLVKGKGMQESALAWSAAPFVLGGAANLAGGFTGDWAVRRWGPTNGRRGAGIASLVLAAICMAAASLSPSGYGALALLAISYAAICLQQPLVWSACIDLGGSASGKVSGAMNTAGQVGSFLFAVTYGTFAAWWGYDRALLPVAGVLLIGAGLWTAVTAEHPLNIKAPESPQ